MGHSIFLALSQKMAQFNCYATSWIPYVISFLIRIMGGGHLYFRLDIILVKGLSKHKLSMYFPVMKIDPKYAFLHAFFLIFHHLFFLKFVTMTKNTLFQILEFLHHKTMYACTLPCPKKKNPNYVNFLQGWYPTSNTNAPLPQLL